MNEIYISKKKIKALPRIPLEASIDLTYRCNNNCRHCWLRIPANDLQKNKELTCDEIKNIVREAKKLGTRHWSISGGEPMLRPDFMEIFDYITSNSISYSINTNGTLITPQIAQLLKRKGTKMIALYGATAEINDHITRNQGSFEATMRGFAYLKEAQAGFMVQLIPMKDNYHQFDQMVELAKSLSSYYRIGAPWLYLSACGNPVINEEIKRQRLSPKDVIELDKPNLSFENEQDHEKNICGHIKENDDRLFASCIANRREFHIDPYGKMSFCSFIKNSELRYDLRKGTLQNAWDTFLPSLADKIKASQTYFENCGSCQDRKNCRWCAVYGFLEHGDFSKKVEYLCDVAKEERKYKENWKKIHRAFYQIGEITIQLDSDLPIKENTFHKKLIPFQTNGPGNDTVYLSHHFELPKIKPEELGQRVYSKAPWSIYKKGDAWIYLGISPVTGEKDLHRVAVFNKDHSRGNIYHSDDNVYQKGDLSSLTLFATDQILLGRLLADRQGCLMHASGIVADGKGLLFIGHSEAGKSTTSLMMKAHGKILCDDRIIIRKKSDGLKIYGTWSHGDVPEISPNSAPLHAIFFLEKNPENKLILMNNKSHILKRLLACLIKPFETTEWWEKELDLIEKIAQEIPCYQMQFNKTGEIVEKIKTV